MEKRKPNILIKNNEVTLVFYKEHGKEKITLTMEEFDDLREVIFTYYDNTEKNIFKDKLMWILVAFLGACILVSLSSLLFTLFV